MGTVIRMGGGKMGASPGTQAQTPPSEGKPSNSLKPDEIWEAALSV